MKYTRYLLMTLSVLFCFLSGCASSVAQDTAPSVIELKPDVVLGMMERVADWQLKQYQPEENIFYDDDSADGHPQGWVYAALHVGLSSLAEVSNHDRYQKALQIIAKRNRYSFAPRIYNADDYAIGQLYIDLYELDPNPEYLAPLKSIFDIILASPSTIDLEFKKAAGVYEVYDERRYSIVPCKNRWCWADAIFMGPPVWMHMASITGEKRFLDFADKEFWETTELLYDKEEHLFYRDTRYFTQREANGAKIFWGRGNGWVIAGLVRILDHLPVDHPNRSRYESLYKEMAAALAKAQTTDGYWRPSLLAPDIFSSPESSGTGFITYGLAWGVNQGLLERSEYLPVISKGWHSLTRAVHPNGKLGWVQQVASKPGSASFNDSQLYGVGAFLLAGSQVLELANVP